MSSTFDPTEQELQIDQLNRRVSDLETQLVTARDMLNTTVGNGKTLEEINQVLQNMYKQSTGGPGGRPGSGSSGDSNLGLVSLLAGKFGSALPTHGEQAFKSFSSATGQFSKVVDEFRNAGMSWALAGRGIAAGITAYEGVVKFGQGMLQSGAITGQGAGAGVGQLEKAVGLGFQSIVNPFAMTTIKFADEIITTFRSAGFKDALAYSLSSSVVNMNNQIGPTMTKQILPVITDLATAIGNQTVNQANYDTNIVDAVASLTENVKILQKSSASTNTSATTNLAAYANLAQTIKQTGFYTPMTGSLLQNFIYQLGSRAGYGLSGDLTKVTNSVSALVAHGILGGYSGLTPQVAFATTANQKKTLQAFGQFFEKQYVRPMENRHSDKFWLQHPDEMKSYIAQSVMPMLNMLGVTMTPDQVKKMITDSMSGGSAVAKGASSVISAGGTLQNEINDVGSSIGGVMSKYFMLGIPLSTSQQIKNLLDFDFKEKDFNKLISKFPDLKGHLNYDEFRKAWIANPHMDINQWIEGKAMGIITKNSLLPTLRSEGVSQEKLNQVSDYITKGLQVIDQQARQGNLSKDDYNREVGDIIQVVVTSTGSDAAFDKALHRKLGVIAKKNGKVVQNKQQMPT